MPTGNPYKELGYAVILESIVSTAYRMEKYPATNAMIVMESRMNRSDGFRNA